MVSRCITLYLNSCSRPLQRWLPDATSRGQGAQGGEAVEALEGAEGQSRRSVVSETAREGGLEEKDECDEEEVDVNGDALDAFFRVFE